MAFQKKEWKNRLAEFPNRRRLEPTGIENTYDVVRAEGNVTEPGNMFEETELNDLESRIEEAFEETASKTDIPTKLPNPQPLTFTGAVTGSHDGSAAKTVYIPPIPAALPANGGTADRVRTQSHPDHQLRAVWDGSGRFDVDVIAPDGSQRHVRVQDARYASSAGSATTATTAQNTNSIAGALTVSTAAPGSTLAAGKLHGVY